MFGVKPHNNSDNDDSRNYDADAVLYHRWWVDRISPRRSGFKSKPVYVGFVLGEKMALGQVSLQVLPVSRQYNRTNILYAFGRLSPTVRKLFKGRRL